MRDCVSDCMQFIKEFLIVSRFSSEIQGKLWTLTRFHFKGMDMPVQTDYEALARVARKQSRQSFSIRAFPLYTKPVVF